MRPLWALSGGLMRNHNRLYNLLNVLPDADPVVIEAAYKALMKRHHPDIHPGGVAAGEPRAAELNQAYRTLRDPDRRAAYDADERVRQERHRAELARAFDPQVPRPAPPPPARAEPTRAGQRAAAWIGAAGVLMLGGALYLLAQGPPAPVAMPVRSTPEVAVSSPGEAERAFRNQPVNRGEVERAVAEFRKIAGSSGVPGAAAYSERCFDAQSRTRGLAEFDHCVAFDHLAARADLVTRSAKEASPQLARFEPQALVNRHIRAAELIAREPAEIEARLYEIRRLADNEIGRLAAAAPVRLSSASPAARPVARAAAQRPASGRTRTRNEGRRPAAPRRAPAEQDFLEREGGIY